MVEGGRGGASQVRETRPVEVRGRDLQLNGPSHWDGFFL